MRKNSLFVLCLLILSLVLTACSSKRMSPASKFVSLPADKACVTFYRSGLMGGPTESPVLESKGSQSQIFGILSNNTKVRCIVRPGKHTFVVIGDSAHQISADLVAGKNYYVRIEPSLGLFRKDFTLVPISDVRIANQNEQEDILKCNLVEKNELTDAWYKENFAVVQGKLLTAKYEAEKEGKRAPRIHTFYGIKAIF